MEPCVERDRSGLEPTLVDYQNLTSEKVYIKMQNRVQRQYTGMLRGEVSVNSILMLEMVAYFTKTT